MESIIEKYRPHNINDMIYSKNIINLYNSLKKNEYIPNLLLYGYSGQGKTTFINIITSELDYNVLFINGSKDRNNNIIKLINTFIKSKNIFNNKEKIIIIDECDSIMNSVQNKLQNIMKNTNISFCYICNYKNEIIEDIQSLCININFKLNVNENKKEIRNYLNNIIINEELMIDEDEIENIINNSNSDIRKMINK